MQVQINFNNANKQAVFYLLLLFVYTLLFCGV